MIIHDCPQGSDEWHALRLSIPTASEGSKMVTSQGAPSKSMAGYAQKLAADMFAGRDTDAWAGNSYTDRGHEVEPEARMFYEMRGTPVQQVGFITDDLLMWGCSPDGLVGDDGLLEIKCLPKQHLKALLYYKANDKAPSDYIVQCQMQILITERKWCDLLYYSPDLPSFVIRQSPNKKIMDELHTQRTLLMNERRRVLNILESMT